MKNVIEMLLERKQCFEKRCKGTHYFANFQIFWDFFVFLLAYSYLCTQNSKVMEIKKAEFTLSAPRESMCNVGKSSLINMLTNNKKLAKTSATPGKTLLINHFIINNEWYLVDLPGYGFAKRSKKEIQKLEQMINGYILQREQLVNVFLLVDVRLEAQKVDLDFILWLGASSVPFAIVFTKADKLSVAKVNQNVEAYKKKLSETWEELPPIFVTSSEKKQGREEILNYIEKINKELK